MKTYHIKLSEPQSQALKELARQHGYMWGGTGCISQLLQAIADKQMQLQKPYFD